jgi:phage tail-like protein
VIELAGLALAGLDAVAPAPGPALVNRDPAPGESDVPRTSAIALEVTVPSGSAVDSWSVRVWVGGALAYDGSAAAPLAPTYAGSGSGAVAGPLTVRVVLVPVTPLPSAAALGVRVVASSDKGTSRIDQTYSFTVEDTSPPVAVAAFSTSARGVRLAFDKPVTLAASAAFTLAPSSTPAVQGSVIGAAASGAFVDLALAAPLSPGVVYSVTSVGLADVNGHVLAAPGSTVSFTAFRPPRPPNRRFDLWSMLPKMNRRADTNGGDLASFIACFQEVTDWLLADLDGLPDLIDIERAPEWMLDLILQDLGNPFTFDLTELQKRKLASILVGIYKLKGTAPGIKNAVRFFVGLDDLQITPLTSTTLVLGESELGVDWELGPGTRFARYAFEATVSRVLTDTERASVQALVRYMKPAHTHFVALNEPVTVVVFDGWEIGTSELGVTTVLN